MAITIALKGYSHYKFHVQLEKNKIEYLDMDTKPTPLNTILWNAQVETEKGYRVAYFSLFDTKRIEFSNELPKNHELLAPFKDQKVVQQLIKIAAGWYVVEEVDGELFFVDLRFGQMGMDVNKSPFFWRYKLTPDSQGKISVTRASADFAKTRENVFVDLWTRIKGN